MTNDEKWINEYMELVNDLHHIDKLPCIGFSKEYIDDYMKKLDIMRKQIRIEPKRKIVSCIKGLTNTLSILVKLILSNSFIEYSLCDKPP